jgi:hypothetical protein
MKRGIGVMCLLSCALALGCGSRMKIPKWPEPMPVKGTVTYDDKPLVNATVSFTPIGQTEGSGAAGMTDDSGKYELKMTWVDGKTRYGIIPGNYRIAFSRMVRPDGTPWKPDPSRPGGPMNSGAREEMPREFALESKITMEVAKGKDVYDFNLKKKK